MNVVAQSDAKRVGFIDFWRGIAILMVTSHHVFQMNPEMESKFNFLKVGFLHFFFPFMRNGSFGVELFFIISAYCLCNKLKRNHNICFDYYTTYIKSRFLRIFPAYFISMIIIASLFHFNQMKNDVAIELLKYNINTFSWYDFFLHCTFLHYLEGSAIHSVNSVLWSLGVEFPMYLLMPILVFYHKKHQIITIVCILVVTIVSAFVIKHNNILQYLPLFLYGVILSRYEFKIQQFMQKYLFKFGFIALLCFLFTCIYKENTASIKYRYCVSFYLGLVMMYSSLFLQFLNSNFSKAIISIGRASYSIYLYQCILCLKNSNSYLISMCLTIIFGFIMFYLVEIPFEKLRKRLMSGVKI